MRSLLTLVLAATAALPAAEGRLLATDQGTDDLRLVVGTAPALRRIDLRGVAGAGSTTHSEEWTGAPRIGTAVGLRYLHGWWMDEDGGLKTGVTLLREGVEATLTREATGDERPYRVTTTSLTLDVGPSIRVDQDSLDFPGDFVEFEFLAHLGAARGVAEAGGVASNSFHALRFGFTAGVILTTFSRWQVGLEAGYANLSAHRLQWGNSAESSIAAQGLVAGLNLGYRW
jgi:hypothetical protein